MSKHSSFPPSKSDGGRESIADYVAAFLVSREANGCAASTLDFYGRELECFSDFVTAWLPDSFDLDHYLAHRRRTVSEVSVRTSWNALSAFLNWCERRHLLSDNPLLCLDRPKKPNRMPKSVSVATLQCLFEKIGEAALAGDPVAIRDRALFALMYATGVRATEAAELLIDDLDLEYGSLLVREGKGNKDRMVCIGQSLTEDLSPWLMIRPACPWLFVSRLRSRLEPLTRKGVYSALKRWGERAGVKLYPHQLRHSHATHALHEGVSLKDLQLQLGHSELATTAIYLDTDDPKRLEAYQLHSPLDKLKGRS